MVGLGGGGPPRHAPSTPGELDISYEDIEAGPSHELGRGASSVVRRVEISQAGGSIPVAVKLPDFEGTIAVEQFERFVAEAETWASLSRTEDDADGLGRADRVVKLVSWGTEPLPWIAMEYMDCGNLRELLENSSGRLPLDQALWVGTAVCEAVVYAHRHGVAHLDLKPSNVLLRNTAEGWPLPKVADWGLAKLMLNENETSKGLTPAYAAPEQFHSDRYGSPEHETDIYQVGVLVYELVTGRLPFEGAASDIRDAKLSEEPPLASDVADVPESVDDVLMTALGREKTERHDDIIYLRDELNALFEQYHSEHANLHTTQTAPSGAEQASKQATTGAEKQKETPAGEFDAAMVSDSDQDVASWNQYKRKLEERRGNAVLYGVLKKVLYRGLASEWEHATRRRTEAEDRYENRATRDAEEVLDTLESQLGEHGEKLFGEPLPDKLYEMRSTIEQTRVKIEDLLRDHKQYLTTGEREIVVDRRDDLAWYERYFQAKRQLDEAVAESAAKLDKTEAQIEETLEEDSLLAADDERSFARDLDGVSETLRRVRRSLDTEVLTDQDVGQFEELLRRERTLRERIQRHNPELVQHRYSERIETATAVREKTDTAIETYRHDGTAFPNSIDTYLAPLREQCEAIDDFLDSRHTEWLSTDQQPRLEKLRETLAANRVVVESKAAFETRLETLQEALSEFEATVSETLDGDSYLDASTRAELDDRLNSLRSQRDGIETDDLLNPLTDDDRARFTDCDATIESLKARIETYNPNLVQERYESHVEMAREVRAELSDDLDPCRQDGGPLPSAAESYTRPLERAIQTLASFLERPQATHLDAEQREEVKSLRDRLAEQQTFVTEKQAFETQLRVVHEELADFRATVDEALNMGSYLTISDREALEMSLEGVRKELGVIDAEGYLDRLAETDTDRVAACRAVLSRLEERIHSYNNRFVEQECKRLTGVLEPLPVDRPNEKQQLAVVRNERHNRVIAGPGTGKTYSLLCRVRYLIDRGIPASDILVLAFNGHTKTELHRRLRREFSVSNVTVKTLHSFGQQLVSNAHPNEFVLVGQSRLREIGRLVRKLQKTDDEFRDHYEAFIELYRGDQLSEDYETRKDRYDSLRFQSAKTFRGEELEPSDKESRVAHGKIADTLFKYGIEYRYRQYADWVTPSDGEPHVPDFTLPSHDVTIEYLPSETAKREREWYEQRRSAGRLRELSEDGDRASIAIHGDDISLSNIEGVLRAKLDEARVQTDAPKSERELINEAYEHNILRRDVETRLGEFVKKAKSNRIDPSAHLDRVDEDENPMRYHFSRVGATIFDAYQEQYETYGAYDYEDMMLRARESVQQGIVDDTLGYRDILVDEFQDLNLLQIEFLQAILDRTGDAHLFAVGDDWQSIYGFRDARPEFFVDFEERFAPATTTRLTINYRSPPAVVRASSAVMAESNVETDKSLEAAPSNTETTPTIHMLAGGNDWQYETNVVTWAARRVEQSIEDENRSPSDILVLARNEEGSPFVPRITTELKQRDIAVDEGWDSVTVTTAHSAKGSEAAHVIVVNAVGDRRDGFPPEEQNSSLTQLVETGNQEHTAEERRLFYMALTRAKEYLDIQTRVGHQSSFLDPLNEHVTYVPVPIDWNKDRVSMTARVENTTETVSRHRQLGTIVVDGHSISYVVPFDARGVELLETGKKYRLENIAVGEYDDNSQLRIDDAATIEML